uniref:Ig-like domain-containing protein n=1 Tax=Esox lucius TaxID=8010 RepID=A0A3P8Y1N1_ESOLU
AEIIDLARYKKCISALHLRSTVEWTKLYSPHLFAGFSGLDLVVTQSPHLTVTEGGTVQIKCCWNQNLIRATVNWKSNATNMSVLVNNRQCQNRSSKHNESCCLNLTISNLNRSDSGTYTCKVSSEIPVLQQSVGNGTHLTVISARQHGSQGKNSCVALNFS